MEPWSVIMSRPLFLLCVAVLLTVPAGSRAETVLVAEKPAKDLAWTVLQCVVKDFPPSARVRLRARDGGREIPVQTEAAEGSLRLVWVVPALAAGSTAEWTADVLEGKEEKGPARVEVREDGPKRTRILVDGKEIAALVHDPDERKPYVYPVIGPNGRPITRAYPMEIVEGEKKDHPHQRSLWFTHGAVGGVDFWSETRSAGRVRQVEIERTESGPVHGRIVTRNEWLAPDGRKVLADRRTLTVYPLEKGEWLLDVEIVLLASEGPVKFGDTKEGTFGIRLAETLKEERGGTGTIVSSRGARGMLQAWGKPAEWVDYYGKVGEDVVGVAILDHPTSFRHPTHWHVRDYALFAANPFGHDAFGEKKDGSHTLPKGEMLRFRYRVYFHHGPTEKAGVERVYQGFASPPPVTPR
jgi:hypothetical protein